MEETAFPCGRIPASSVQVILQAGEGTPLTPHEGNGNSIFTMTL